MTAEQFATIRTRLGLTQAQLAKRLCYSHVNSISQLETGARSIPAHVELLMIAYRDGYQPRANPTGKD
jgi:transcriptional regulator with XRE-family HTH domain